VKQGTGRHFPWNHQIEKDSLMVHDSGGKEITENRRKMIFRAIVNAQDQKLSVIESRRLIAKRYGLTESQIRRIEQEGLDRQWPPL
jgi:2-hydroxychromene-2-carboxylate isomerase